ncbi:hypothetical protein QBC35DRAFT_493122 [Podospora australis]|uniref:Uncharacterized protein n=1 Tax=Podospora australis TaxID=1536484 RepID=A0AAN7AJL2_9PEZI|nr:hypothetical protein QBC35DRAFT_493122 [Podospora australis]
MMALMTRRIFYPSSNSRHCAYASSSIARKRAWKFPLSYLFFFLFHCVFGWRIFCAYGTPQPGVAFLDFSSSSSSSPRDQHDYNSG